MYTHYLTFTFQSGSIQINGIVETEHRRETLHSNLVLFKSKGLDNSDDIVQSLHSNLVLFKSLSVLGFANAV